VAQIGFVVDPQQRAPERLLEDWSTLVDVAEAAHRAGVRVSVAQACQSSQTLLRNGVTYHFFAADEKRRTSAHSAEFASLVQRLDADVYHVHGLCFPAEVQTLAQLAPGTPILLQDHASHPPRSWRRPAWRRGFAAATAVSFCAREQGAPFAAAGLIGADRPIFEIPESTSRFTPGDQAAARALTGLSGSPCLLWVGHLDENKDPLCVLDGIADTVRELPDLKLWCCFAGAPLMRRVQRRIRTDPRLAGRVHLLGKVAHSRIQDLMRAADLFVLGSHREGSGYALIEALACGLPPVVTDIPSFRALTGRGAVGRLWPCGDRQALSHALRAATVSARDERALVRTHFERTLSLDALGRALAAAYGRLGVRNPPGRGDRSSGR
jgi:glycosyltransferase involved in cell wall biosynthesis